MKIQTAAVAALILQLVVPAARAEEAPAASARLTITSHDGFQLTGRFHRAGAEGAAVLLLHQCDREGESTGMESLARGLAESGIHALEMDLRGYGGSRSEAFNGENWQEAQEHADQDVRAAHGALLRLPGVERGRIAVLGASCGGRFAVSLARSTGEIRAIVFLSTGLGRAPAEFLGEARSLPLLGIAGEKDPYGMTVASMRSAFEASDHPSSTLLLLKGAAHGAPLLTQEPRLERIIIDWLADRLR